MFGVQVFRCGLREPDSRSKSATAGLVMVHHGPGSWIWRIVLRPLRKQQCCGLLVCAGLHWSPFQELDLVSNCPFNLNILMELQIHLSPDPSRVFHLQQQNQNRRALSISL